MSDYATLIRPTRNSGLFKEDRQQFKNASKTNQYGSKKNHISI